MNDTMGLMEPPQCEISSPRSEALSDGLTKKRARLIAQLAQVDEALAALAENPQVEKVFNLLMKTNRI